jgi:hypothetical protein
MTDYVKSTNFASKDALSTGNPLKIVKGTEIDTEFNNIATAVATKAPLNSPTFIGTPAAPTASTGTNTTQLATTAFVQNTMDVHTVSTAQIEDAAVTTAKLADTAVTTAKITDANVTSAKLANGAATGAKLGSDVVVTSGDQTIGGTKTFSSGVRFNDGTTQTTAAVGPRSWQSLSMPNYTNVTNTFGKEIIVSVWCNPNGSFGWTDQCFVDNTLIVVATWDSAFVGMSYVFPVPAGSTFRVEFPTGVRGAMAYR